ncbi:MAG: DUF2860 family protein [Deltaproteobacteria bacterium]|nr:DUF2860 family protein [Deltaproteobacteria bacterium]
MIRRLASFLIIAYRGTAAALVLSLSLATPALLPAMAVGAEKPLNSVEIGGIYMRQANHFSTDGPARIDDLNGKAVTESKTRPFALISLSGKYGDNNLLYLKTDIEQMDDANIYLGTEVPLSEKGNRLDIAVFTSPFFGEVWKNPYKTGSDREETDVIRYGARVAVRDILGTSLSLSFKAAAFDVDDDEIGRMYSSLRRDGTVYTLAGEYRVRLTEGLSMTPSLRLTRGDMDGGSNAFDGYSVGIKWMYRKGDMMVMPLLRYAFVTYDETHPIFNKKREDNHYLGALMATYSNLFGFRGFFVRIIGGYSAADSNITFCDGTGKFAGVTVGYRR